MLKLIYSPQEFHKAFKKKKTLLSSLFLVCGLRVWNPFSRGLCSGRASAVPGWDVYPECDPSVLLCWNDRWSLPMVPCGGGASPHPLLTSTHCLQVSRVCAGRDEAMTAGFLLWHKTHSLTGSWFGSWSAWTMSRNLLSSPTSRPAFRALPPSMPTTKGRSFYTGQCCWRVKGFRGELASQQLELPQGAIQGMGKLIPKSIIDAMETVSD